MPAVHTLTRGDRREIEAALRSDLRRTERALGVADGRYQALDDALRRLESGDYGLCVYCHQPIPTGRLLVMPETDHCIGCGA